MKNGQNKLTIKKIVNYCPQCEGVPDESANGNAVPVAMECLKHQPKFVKTGTGIMVPENFFKRFKEITQSAVLSSQEI